jgi:NhaA family Na+:H+ antiporter
VLRSLQNFIRLESSGGLVLMGTSVFALIIAKSPFSPYYAKLLDLPLEIRIGTHGIAKPLLLWINDGGKRVPTALKAFLLSVAIFDDLGAVVVIALFYTAELSVFSLVIAACLLLGLACLNRWNVTRPAAYFLLGIPLWVAVLKSGVHATLAGVALAMFIPLRVPEKSLASKTPEPPLHHLEHTLHPWVAFGVLPVFAFANAGVPILGLSITDIFHPVPLGIVTGLFLGKQIGILALCWLAVRFRIASPPEGVSRWQLYGTSLLCGIGFTMSLFIASLAFEQGATAYLGLERLGILIGTLISGLSGYVVLRLNSGSES